MDVTPEPSAGVSLSLRLLGPFDLQIGGDRVDRIHSRKEQWLLALLALRSGREVTREWLAGTLWPDSLKQQAAAYLRRSLYLLKAALGEEGHRILTPSARSLCLDTSGAFVDVTAFDAAVARGDSASLQEAIALYRGPLLEGCDEEWAAAERQTRELSFLNALDTLADQVLNAGDPRRAISYLRRLVQADPLRESAHRLLMRALAEAGDYAAMIQVYRDLRLFLRREVNSDPSPETVHLLEDLRSHARVSATRRESPAVPVRTAEIPSVDLSPLPMPDLPLSPAIAPSLPDHPSYLSRPLTPLIGREREVHQVRECLAQTSLVTLTGTAGVGKTRVAMEVAQGWHESSVWFVELAPVAAGTALEHVVAHVLGVKEQSGSPAMETLEMALASRSGLLVLDNCEHVAEECGVLAMRLLDSCPHLYILATSRQSLGVLGEAVYPIAPLRTPPPGAMDAVSDPGQTESLLMYAAVQMFMDSARRTSPEISLNPESTAAIARICTRLDGVPLALELAAARLRVLSPEQIWERLDSRPRLLTAGSRPDIPHHLSMHATLEWSYDLLTDPQRRLLHRLSVFNGGWTLEMAERVCADEPPEERKDAAPLGAAQILPLLAALVHHSLVVFLPEAPEPRYRMLEAIRQYAAEKLAASGEKEVIQRRHCRQFLDFAEQCARGVDDHRQSNSLRRLETEHDNLRAALRWSLTEESSPETALRLCASAASLWKNRGCYREGAEWCEAALARTPEDEPSAVRANALAALGTMRWMLGDLEGAYRYHLACLNLRRVAGDERAAAAAQERVGAVALRLGRPAESRERIEAAIHAARRFDDWFTLAHGLINLGCLEVDADNNAAAQAAWEEALIISQAAGNDNLAAYSYGNLGYLMEQRGDYEEARSLYSRSVDLFLQSGNKEGAAFMILGMGTLAEAQGDYEQSRALLTDALQNWIAWGNKTNMLLAVERLVFMQLSELKSAGVPAPERYRHAALILGGVEAARERFQCAPAADVRTLYAGKIAQLNTALGAEVMSRAWAEGSVLPFDRIVGLALDME